jgi:glutamine synthetase adenylyltransferase
MGPFLLVLVIAFALITIFIAAYTRRVADAALTDPFRAAESITNGKFPEKWVAQINRRLALKRLMPALMPEVSGTGQALQKIDRLIRFFEKSPFFENKEARELLLSRLKETRQRWEQMTWEEIGEENRSGANSTADDKPV